MNKSTKHLREFAEAMSKAYEISHAEIHKYDAASNNHLLYSLMTFHSNTWRSFLTALANDMEADDET